MTDLEARSHTLHRQIEAAALLALGQLICAYEIRRHYRKKVAPRVAALNAASRQARDFGSFDDCGEFYRAEVVESRTALIYAGRYRTSAEKFYKRQAHEFRERYPEFSDVIPLVEHAAQFHYSSKENGTTNL